MNPLRRNIETCSETDAEFKAFVLGSDRSPCEVYPVNFAHCTVVTLALDGFRHGKVQVSTLLTPLYSHGMSFLLRERGDWKLVDPDPDLSWITDTCTLTDYVHDCQNLYQ